MNPADSKARLAFVAVAGLLLACATPAERYDATARALGLARRSVDVGIAELVLYEPVEPRAGHRLHVYIEGDGLPRTALDYDPPDPTPGALALRLMAADPAPALLLGRPCQHGASRCDPRHWTFGRYSEGVVAAMTRALRSAVAATGASEVVLVGFSGGGTIAMLMAERVAETVAVVTLAGNLDVAAWTRHHGYRALRGSLDPAQRLPLPPRIVQFHLHGGRDEVVPPGIVRTAIERQSTAVGRVFPDFDHGCCWADAWPSVLVELERRLDRAASEHEATADRE